MEKEKLSTELKGLVGETSISDRTWNDYLENTVLPFLPSEEEKIGDFLGKHATALKSLGGQLNNEIATKVNEFKKTYKPEPATPPNTESKLPDEKLNEIETRLHKFEKAEAEKQELAIRTAKLDDAKKMMQEQGASHDKVLNLIMPQLKVTNESDITELAKQGKALYDKAYSDLYGDSYVPAFGGGSGSSNSKSDKDAYKKHLVETGRLLK